MTVHTRDNPDPLFGISQRQPPANLQAEQSLLGALLANNKVYDRVRFLEPHHFADPIHARIYVAIVRRIEAGHLADAVTLKAELEHAGILEEVGGTAYLAQLLTAMVGLLNATEYARAIHDCWARRKLVELGQVIVSNAFGGEIDAPAQIEQLGDEVAALTEAVAPMAPTQRRAPVLLADAIATVADRAEAIHAGRRAGIVTTGIRALDRALGGGLDDGTLNFLIGLSQTGKSELAMQIAESAAGRARSVWEAADPATRGAMPAALYLCLGDMKAEQLAARSAARLSGGEAKLRDIRHGNLDVRTANGLRVAHEVALTRAAVMIADSTTPTSAGVTGEIRRFCAARPCPLVVVDNYTDMLVGSVRTKDAMLFQAIGIASDLKRLAQQLGVPILLLMHMNKSVAERPDPTPRHGDIPWGTAGACDTAIGIWRPILGVPKKPPERPARMTEKGELVHQQMVNDWHKKREALANVTELVPLKLREDEEGVGGQIARLTFDRDTQSFLDPPETESESAAPDMWGVG